MLSDWNGMMPVVGVHYSRPWKSGLWASLVRQQFLMASLMLTVPLSNVLQRMHT
jgi:hypothetical protein